MIANSIQSEAAVLGGVLVHPSRYHEVASFVRAEDFYQPAHSAIFAAMAYLAATSLPIDPITVADRLDREGTTEKLSGVGGVPYLAQLMGDVVTVENIAYHAKQVGKKAERRRWAETLRKSFAESQSDGIEDDEFFTEVEKSMVAMSNNRRAESSMVPLKPLLRDVSKDLDVRYERRNENGVFGVPTGIGSLDRMTGGLQDGELVIIAGRPSMGKSAIAMNIAASAAANDVAGLVFSLEMSDKSLGERLIATEGRIDSRKLRSGQIEKHDWLRITTAVSTLVELPLWICERGGESLSGLISLARRWSMSDAVKQCKRRAIYVDYMQLMSNGVRDKNSNRTQEVSEISRGLKLLAKELNCPVVALSQLNRSLESRADKRPMMSDLRESGAIEQDADVIAFVYRNEVYEPDKKETKGTAELIIGKNRNGPIGMLPLTWKADISKFYETTER